MSFTDGDICRDRQYQSEQKGWQHKLEQLAIYTIILCCFITPISVSATTITYLFAWVLLLLSGNWAHRWQRIKSNPAALSFWALFAIFLLGLTYTSSSAHQAFHDLQKRHWMLITPFLMAALATASIRRKMINAFFLAMVLTVALSYLKYYFPSMMPHFLMYNVNPGDIFFSYIVQNVFVSIAAVLAGYRALYQARHQKLYALLFLLMSFNIFFMSAGRTGYLVYCLLVAYLFVYRFRFKGLLFALSGLCLFFTLGYYLLPVNLLRWRVGLVVQHIEDFEHGSKHLTSLGVRLEMLEVTKALFSQRPWFGQGTGGIAAAQQALPPETYHHLVQRMDYVENSYLNFLLQFGVIGFLAFMGVVGLQCYLSFLIPDRELRFITQAYLMAFFVGALVNSFFVSFVEAHMYSLFAAVGFSALPPFSRKRSLDSEQIKALPSS